VTLLPIEYIAIQSGKGSAGYWFASHKEPHAIIICGTYGIRAFNLEAKEVSLDHLAQTAADLASILASLT
jgi:hypothetical protein